MIVRLADRGSPKLAHVRSCEGQLTLTATLRAAYGTAGMGRAFDLAKAREAIRRTQRQMSVVQERLKVKSTPISFSASRARDNLRDAATAMRRLRALIDAGRVARL